MKVATKLSGAFAVLVITLAGLLVYHVRTIHRAVSANFELSEISSRLYLSTTRQIGLLNQLEENAGKFWVTRDEGYLQLFQQAFRDFENGLRNLEATAPTSPEGEEIERLAELWSEFRPVAEQVGNKALISDPPAPALRQLLASLRQQVRRVSDASQAAMAERLEASATAAHRAERISWVAAAGTLLLSVLVFTLIVRSISSALARLQRGTHEVAQGNFEYRLPADRGDEFAQLAREFNVMTRRLGELDRMKRDFLSKVSHDLKTPLASMQETVQVMLDGVAGPVTAKQRRLLDLTNQSARRLSSMITKILDLSAMEAGALALELRVHEVRTLVEPALDSLALGDPERRPFIVTELPEGPVLIDCDRDRIVQIVVNLLENAVKFSPPGAPVYVTARLVGSRDPAVPVMHWRRLPQPGSRGAAALIEVHDRGPGVPDADKRRIFEHFFQSSNGNRISGRGVGLGLAICREIIDLHGGAIWVRDNPQGGSTFAVLLPRATAGALPVRAVSAPEFETSSARG